jgi:hypothetical protein
MSERSCISVFACCDLAYSRLRSTSSKAIRKLSREIVGLAPSFLDLAIIYRLECFGTALAMLTISKHTSPPPRCSASHPFPAIANELLSRIPSRPQVSNYILSVSHSSHTRTHQTHLPLLQSSIPRAFCTRSRSARHFRLMRFGVLLREAGAHLLVHLEIRFLAVLVAVDHAMTLETLLQ